MSLKTTFVRLGILVIVVTGLIQGGIIDLEGFNKTNEDVAPRITKKQTSGSTSTQKVSDNATTSPQQPIDESQWELVADKTCTIGWGNQDFREEWEGWCLVGNIQPGEYRFEARSSLTTESDDGSQTRFPESGIPTQKWRARGYNAYADYMDEWIPIRNKIMGMIIVRAGDQFPIPAQKVKLDQQTDLFVSANIPLIKNDWVIHKYKGRIQLKVFKKTS